MFTQDHLEETIAATAHSAPAEDALVEEAGDAVYRMLLDTLLV